MPSDYTNEPMLEMFLFESSQLIGQLEELILAGEKEGVFSQADINEIFRIMHTIKGSAAMMMFQNISTLAHSMEDIFYILRNSIPAGLNYSLLSDLVLEGVDFIKVELEKIKNHDDADGNPEAILHTLKEFQSDLNKGGSGEEEQEERPKNSEKQQYYIMQNKILPAAHHNIYRAVIYFEDGCEMENIRAYTILHTLKEITDEFCHFPSDIIENDESIEAIRKDGFVIYLKCNETYERMQEFFNQTIFLKEMELDILKEEAEYETMLQHFNKVQNKDAEVGDAADINPKNQYTRKTERIRIPEVSVSSGGDSSAESRGKEVNQRDISTSSGQQTIISVSVAKLDKLMDLVGEMVIAEAMVIQNPDLNGLELDNFDKAAHLLDKITGELQDVVMSIRMVPLSTTFHKMNRIVRDMCRKLNKEAELVIIGEETEVDKNIIEHISDPLMHLVRNAVDHGLETAEERSLAGKSQAGLVTLEAKNAGSDVLIIIKDDGRGLDKRKIIAKASEMGIPYNENMTDREIFNLILLPGFSTKEGVTEFSGRGVGMDVVSSNIETIGGTLTVDSHEGAGTTFTLKIPLTLAIIDGMNIRVGDSCYTIPTASIRESFRPKERDIIKDPDGNELIMVRGKCLRIIRIHELYRVETPVKDLTKGIIILVEQDEKNICIFADELIGQQQVVVKALPNYIKRFKKIRGLAGCTLLGDGSISLILDTGSFINM